ncbi:MAG: TIGR01244 family phosphatase, partial [Gammaproteobacteria bacterium]|nr:TIGR01244 family phosphatase [Gammaproteobacteria bacterium]
MEAVKKLTPFLSVIGQIQPADMADVASSGFLTVINNRPDEEGEGQPSSAQLAAAAHASGLEYHHLPVVAGQIQDENISDFAQLLAQVKGPVLAFCRTGTRSSSLWALSEAHHLAPNAIIEAAQVAGYDLSGLLPRLQQRSTEQVQIPNPTHSAQSHPYDVLVVGGGAAGCTVTASLLSRNPALRIGVVEPSEQHYYQPGWTMVGAGVFTRSQTERPMVQCIPEQAQWIRAAVTGFLPEQNTIVLEDGRQLAYRTLIVCPGLKLHWDAIKGLRESLGQNGVTSNYMLELAPYTWQLVQNLRQGRALFTQPPMPIKCAGAPQKAMYMSADWWLKEGVLNNIETEFYSAGGALFGVADFVPPLMEYVKKYNAQLNFHHNLVEVDGAAGKAWFEVTDAQGNQERIEKSFDFLHAVPPQRAPRFVRESTLADAQGWLEVHDDTLRHTRFGNIFGLGDVCSTPNAKTAAAVRKQAPVVAENVLAVLNERGVRAV